MFLRTTLPVLGVPFIVSGMVDIVTCFGLGEYCSCNEGHGETFFDKHCRG